MTLPAETRETDNIKRYRLIITVFFGIPAIMFTALAVPQIKSDLALQQSEHIVKARVTDWQISPKYSIRYTFVIDGVEASHSDSTGRKNLWASIPENVWRETKTTGAVDVRYDPANIFSNTPVCKPVRFVDTFAALGLGILCFVIAAAVWFWPDEHLKTVLQQFKNSRNR